MHCDSPRIYSKVHVPCNKFYIIHQNSELQYTMFRRREMQKDFESQKSTKLNENDLTNLTKIKYLCKNGSRFLFSSITYMEGLLDTVLRTCEGR